MSATVVRPATVAAAAASLLPAETPRPERLPTVGPPPRRALRQVASVVHQGTVIAFARAATGSDVFYDLLDLHVGEAADADQWTGFTKLAFPDELRPAGLGIVTVDDAGGRLETAVDTPLKAVSDGSDVCLFQQSSRGTLLLNRFMLKRVPGPGGGAAVPVLEPIWEVRFQRSGKPDTPD